MLGTAWGGRRILGDLGWGRQGMPEALPPGPRLQLRATSSPHSFPASPSPRVW